MFEQKNDNSNNENIQSERSFVSDIIIQHDDSVMTDPSLEAKFAYESHSLNDTKNPISLCCAHSLLKITTTKRWR